MGIEIQTPGAGVTLPPQASSAGFGAVTGPAAGGTIATVGTPAAGIYRADVYLQQTGTLTAAEVNNVQLLFNGGPTRQIPVSGLAAASQVPGVFSVVISVNGINPVSLVAIALAGAAAVYTATLLLTRVG